MTTVTLNPELVQQIENWSSQGGGDAQSFVEKAVRTYLGQMRQEKIRTETEAFNEQYDMLKANYAGQYVAVHQGKVIDHDTDIRSLHLRVYEQLGRTPVLLKQVMDEPERELHFRSPRLERKRI
jgi:metal-responsive CopG/Arc/MetJ family transcriptional regulator